MSQPDPRVRRDGLCVVCKAERTEAAVKYDDPFCSVTCCQSWHGVASASATRSATTS